MGCASSTPMVATAGSEMLKAATHVASDAAKSAEHAVEEVSESVGKSLDTAKETVGTAVTGIAHDLGSVFTEKSGELDTAKNQLFERLHLGGAAGANKALEQTVASTTANHLDASALEAAARAPTPPPDLDSLKTSTPEPEIERAMANASEDTPPTPKATIAELEKLTAEMKQTAQTTVAAAVTDSAVEANKQSNAGEVSSGTAAATEPAVDMVAWLAAEKRPGTTEWEKHADHLSKTRKVSEFKGGGKFRRFGPSLQAAIKPANYHKPMENMRRTLLEDDSCYSDAYYNSHSSPQHSSASDSPRMRRARLPINGVLAANAKRMQREFATFVSNRRSGLRSLAVSPAGRHFDYNPQRPRFGSPTPSVIGYTRSGYSTPTLVMNPELLPNPLTTSWKRGMGASRINSPPSRVGRLPTRAGTSLNTPLTTNVVSQSKVKSTKAFASLRAESNGRTRIFGQTRSGSPTNRRVFAKRTSSPPKGKGRLIYARSESPVRGKPLKQNKVMATTKVKPLRQASTKIRLEREASIKETKESPKAEISANIFSLSRALSPIKIAAESHSLPHLKSAEQKVTPTASSLLQVVEQAVERAKNGGALLDIGTKESSKVAETSSTKNEVSTKNGKRKETPRKSQKMEEKSSERKSASGSIVKSNKNFVNNKSPNKVRNKRENQDGVVASTEDAKKQTPSPLRQSSRSNSISSISKRRNSKSGSTTPSPMRRYSKGGITMDKKGLNNVERNHDQQVSSEQKVQSPKNIEGDIEQGIRGRFSMSPNKKHTFDAENSEQKRKLWTSSSPDGRKPTSSRSIARETKLNTRRNSMQSSVLFGNSSPDAKQRDNHVNKSAENHHGSSSEHSSRVNQTTPESKRAKSNSSHSTRSNWSSYSRRSSHVEYTNISNRFESNAVQSAVRKESSPSPRKFNLSSSNHTENKTITMKQQMISPEFDKISNLSPKDEQFKDHIENIQNSQPNVEDYGHDKRRTNTINKNSRYHGDELHEQNYINHSDEDIVVKTASSSKSNSSTKSVQSQGRNSNEYFMKDFTNHKRIPSQATLVNNKANNSHRNDEHKVQNPQTSTHQSNISPTKQNVSTRHSPNQHSNKSSPSKSSKSSTSIVIRTNLSTPETEEYSEDALNRELSVELEQLKRYDDEPTDEIEESFLQLTSVEEENLHRDLKPYTRTDHHESSSQTDYEVETRSDAELSYHTDIENSTTSSTSFDDLINMLTPETAYLNLGRSATMMTLKPTKSEFDTNISSFHSTPRHSPYVRRFSSPYDSGQSEKVIFVAELSPMARSRSPHVSSSFKMADHCNVCHNEYVIK